MKLYGLLGFVMTFFALSGPISWILRLLDQKYLKGKAPAVKSLVRFLKKYHRYMAGSILVIGPVHGWLALGGFRFHTGTLLMQSILLMMIIYLLGHFKLYKGWLKLHRMMAVIVLLLWLVHYVFPWLI